MEGERYWVPAREKERGVEQEGNVTVGLATGNNDVIVTIPIMYM